MRYPQKFLLLTALTLLIHSACQKNDSLTEFGPRVTTAFAGQVLDELGNPVQNATVETEQVSAVTDAYGIFRLPKVKTRKRNAVLHITATGFYPYSRAFVVNDGSVQTASIRLISKSLTYELTAGIGGKISMPDGMSLTFPGSAVVKENGSPYFGAFYVHARALPADDPDLSLKMPGDLRGVTAAGEEGILSSFGMIAVELVDIDGNTLKIASDKSVTLQMDIPASMQNVAPETIALWYYDLETARWKEEGAAQKFGGQYVGEVKHFSFWNCDAYSENVYIEGKVLINPGSKPIGDAQVRLTVLADGFQGCGFTNLDGWFGGAVPVNKEMLLEVLLPGECGHQVLYSQTIGPFSENTQLPDILISAVNSNLAVVSGRLIDCNGHPVSDGFAVLKTPQYNYPVFVDPDGTFTFATLSCINGLNCSLQAYDNVQGLSSDPVNLILQNNNPLGDILVCKTLESYIHFTLDGKSVLAVDPYFSRDSMLSVISSSVLDSSFYSASGIVFSFTGPIAPGSYELASLQLAHDIFYNPYTTNPKLITTVSEYAFVLDGFISGSFAGNFTDNFGNSHTIGCNYHVKLE